MTAQVLDGRATAKAIRGEIAVDVAVFASQYGRAPAIAVVQVEGDPASAAYVRQIEKTFTGVGMSFKLHLLSAQCDAQAMVTLIKELNADSQVDGIIVQMPLPKHLPQSLVTGNLAPSKDVDGIHPANAGKLFQGAADYLAPATPTGGMELLRRYNIPLKGKHAVVVGRSNVVGRPMALLMLHQNATVTMCHSQTADLPTVTRQADILVAAIGKPGMITADMVNPGAVVVDFGVNMVGDKMVGDVDTDAVGRVASYITPVPGGTGPMTNVMLMLNTLAAGRRNQQAE
ncbi:MAG: bifunctional 5,10-methylenetetrahydrofolate dehydrogenase/5,10-methenyltetrahydrofolate cyclohydrolase [Anaerolineae bacterium]